MSQAIRMPAAFLAVQRQQANAGAGEGGREPEHGERRPEQGAPEQGERSRPPAAPSSPGPPGGPLAANEQWFDSPSSPSAYNRDALKNGRPLGKPSTEPAPAPSPSASASAMAAHNAGSPAPECGTRSSEPPQSSDFGPNSAEAGANINGANRSAESAPSSSSSPGPPSAGSQQTSADASEVSFDFSPKAPSQASTFDYARSDSERVLPRASPRNSADAPSPAFSARPSAAAALALAGGPSRAASLGSLPGAPSAASLAPSMPAVDSAYDRYGFRKRNAHITEAQYDEWYAQYEPYQKRRMAKWTQLLKDSGLAGGPDKVPVRFPPNSDKLKRYIRKGIPPEWRGAAWFWFARGHEKINANPGLYARLVQESVGLRNTDTEHIERDLHRTFPDNRFFRSMPGTLGDSDKIQQLRRVLVAFSCYQPKIGYCQSLNYIAGNLLLFMDEERAFWMLVIITNNLLQGLHEVNLEQVNIAQGILMIAVRDRLPKVWNALGLDQQYQENFVAQLPPISLCTAGWFMCMFVCVLPTETMLRVWDVFFFEGPKVLYRVSLTLLKMVEVHLGKLADDAEVFQAIQSCPQQMLNATLLMHTCFKRANGFGHLSDNDIAALRQFVVARRRGGRTDPQKSTDRDEYAKFRPRQRLRSRLHLY